MQRILVIQTAYIGDVILSTPVFRELGRLFPLAKIDLLVRKGNASFLMHDPAVHERYEFDKEAGKLREILRLTSTFRKNKYDLIINLHRFGSSGIITVLSGGKKTYGFKKNPFSIFYTKRFEHQIGNGTHEVERNLSIIKEFGSAALLPPVLYPGPEAEASVLNYKRHAYYCFAPASVWFTKQLPEQKWVELIKLKSAFGKIYFLGAPADHDLCQRIIDQSLVGNVENLAGKLTLLESAALIRDAKRTYVNDSGPLHIASAMNAAVTAFFCSTTPNFGFGPIAEDAEIIESNKPLDCKPCGLHGYHSCPKKHYDCGNTIELIATKS